MSNWLHTRNRLREISPDRRQSFDDDSLVRPFVQQRCDNILNTVDGQIGFASACHRWSCWFPPAGLAASLRTCLVFLLVGFASRRLALAFCSFSLPVMRPYSRGVWKSHESAIKHAGGHGIADFGRQWRSNVLVGICRCMEGNKLRRERILSI